MGIATLRGKKIEGLFHKKFLRESGEIFGKMSMKHEIIMVQQDIINTSVKPVKLGKFEIFSVNVTEKLGNLHKVIVIFVRDYNPYFLLKRSLDLLKALQI